MNTNSEHGGVGAGYPVGQLAQAFVAAATHEDADTRQRANQRLRRWMSVLRGMATGTLSIGSRTPVAGLPTWVTPEVVRGGFATGSAVASGPLLPQETAVAERAGVPAERRALFAYYLSEPGLAELYTMLDSGAYRVEVPEEAALLVVAWLVRAGDRAGALALLEELGPYADRLRFAPVPADVPAQDPAIVWRESAGKAYVSVARRRPNERVEAMREALTVWNPFADELLSLWLETIVDGRVGERIDDAWRERAAALLARYRVLAAVYTRCSKHRRPKENLAILRSALEDSVAGRALAPRTRGPLQHAVDAMWRRRGEPGSPRHAAVRAEQAAVASTPTHHALARIAAARLAALPPNAGVRDIEAVIAPVRADEARDTGLPAGVVIPEPIQRVVRRALAGTVEELIAAGVVPSAEVLAELVPQIAAATTAVLYRDEALRPLMAATYSAFRRRRSVLLLNLEHQVRLDELPWVRAVAGYRDAGDDTRGDADAALRRLGELTLDAFPATVLPNPLVRELAALSQEAGAQLPWVEELAADIFEGTFSAKYLAAAKVAGKLLACSLYERYYGIDYAQVLVIDDVSRRGRYAATTSPTFDALCHARAGATGGGYSVAANGIVIEQAQILTTHNLATLVGRVGVHPAHDWATLARRAFATVTALAARVPRNPRPLSTIKDIAYAWRHVVFYLSLPGATDPTVLIGQLGDDLAREPAPVRDLLHPALAGLTHIAVGGTFAADGTAGPGRRLLGWSVDRHWMRLPRQHD